MNIPTWLQDLLGEIQTLDRSAHIAGGYLRDLDNGKTPKDIDIFMSNLPEAFNVEELIKRSHPEMVGRVDAAYESSTGDVNFAWAYRSPSHLDVNLIGLNGNPTMLNSLNRFDYGVCRIAFNGATVRSSEYLDDVNAKTFTLMCADTVQQVDRSIDRYKRIGVKYPDWNLVIPAKYRNLL